ncbi:MAG TPA: protein phosphatase 2C domain-containing protein [Myxococcales bacterium]|jgi:serine/threonine protein phosphatase PrpC
MPFSTANLVIQAKAGGQDRHLVVAIDGGLVLVVADGAGGTSNGGWAADFVIRKVELAARGPLESIDPAALLATIDGELLDANWGGQSTAVLALVTEDRIRGASVGDSAALVVGEAGVSELTSSQVRKPLLGDGMAQPVAFSSGPLGADTLLLATDGLTKYVAQDKLALACRHPELIEIPRKLGDLVRPASGGLWDDVAAIVCRRD